MIRYHCPSCQRLCESVEALRGFTVICLGCRNPIKVPKESTVAEETPAPKPFVAAPTPKPVIPDVSFSKPTEIIPTVEVPAAARSPIEPLPSPSMANSVEIPVATPSPILAPPLSPTKPPEIPKPMPSVPVRSPRDRRLFLRIGIAVLLAALVILAGSFGWSWYSKRKAVRDRLASAQAVEARQQEIRENFSKPALRKLSEKTPKWTDAPTDAPTLKGKVVVLSFVDDAASTTSTFVKDLFERGTTDELMFQLPEDRWSRGIGELDSIVGIRFRKETVGVVRDGKPVELKPAELKSATSGSSRPVQRWVATVIALDKASAKITGRKEFVGKLPSAVPAGDKPLVGPRPVADINAWIEKAIVEKQ